MRSCLMNLYPGMLTQCAGVLGLTLVSTEAKISKSAPTTTLCNSSWCFGILEVFRCPILSWCVKGSRSLIIFSKGEISSAIVGSCSVTALAWKSIKSGMLMTGMLIPSAKACRSFKIVWNEKMILWLVPGWMKSVTWRCWIEEKQKEQRENYHNQTWIKQIRQNNSAKEPKHTPKMT